MEKQKLVYILGASHSGTTLTTSLLNAHPKLCSVGELKAEKFGEAQSYLCSCRKSVSECGFWNDVSRRMEANGEDFDIADTRMHFSSFATPYITKLLGPLHRGPLFEIFRDGLLNLSALWRGNLQPIYRRNAIYVKSLLEITGADWVVDSSKIGIRLKYLLKNPYLDVKVIWMVRDARGVALAYSDPSEFADSRNHELRGGGTGQTQEEKRGVARGSLEWIKCNREARSLVNLIDTDRWMLMRYEDLCSTPELVLNRLSSFIGVDQNQIDIKRYKSMEHHILGNGMRLDTDPEIKLDERWRSELLARDVELVDSVAARMYEEFGYQ